MAKPAHTSPNAQPLSINGLIMPSDFPTATFETIHSKLALIVNTYKDSYFHFAGSWNAISYRYLALAQYGEAFSASITAHGTAPTYQERYEQERQLFGFFSNGFSTFEAFFYGMFATGTILAPGHFSLTGAQDQQRVTPARTVDGFRRAFPNDPVVSEFSSLLADPAYKQWREIRNVLTHRTAPGRTFFVSVGEDQVPPGQWKLLNISLDNATMPSRRAEASRLINRAMTAALAFVSPRFPLAPR